MYLWDMASLGMMSFCHHYLAAFNYHTPVDVFSMFSMFRPQRQYPRFYLQQQTSKSRLACRRLSTTVTLSSQYGAIFLYGWH